MTDDNDVRTLLRTSDVPPSRLTTSGLLSDAKRSYRRRQVVKASLAVLTVVAVAVPGTMIVRGAVGPRGSTDPTGFADRAAAEHRRDPVGTGALSCEFVAMPLPVPPLGAASIADVDANGAVAVGTADNGAAIAIWRDGTVRAVSGRTDSVFVFAVNSAGYVVGQDPDGSGRRNWVHSHDTFKDLPTPDGFRRARVAVLNERGDALGVLLDDSDASVGLVVWPDGDRSRPRVYSEAGTTPVALRGDGTVIGLRHRDVAELVVVAPDGRRDVVRAPEALNASASALLYGDFLFSQSPESHPVRWNLKTGRYEVFDSVVGGLRAANSGGWIVLRLMDGSLVTVAPDGAASTRPVNGYVQWVSAGGKTLIGNRDDGVPGTWQCT